jgi:hypothetical protein
LALGQSWHNADCHEGATLLRTIAAGAGIEVRLEDRFQYQLGSALYYAVSNRWDAEWPLAVAPGLWDHHPPAPALVCTSSQSGFS